ncbi:hypothetical protein PRIC2_013468 [Phytophthora ramorum]
MSSDVLVERTYQALMGVVQTTAFDLFSEQQMDFSTLTTKQAKAAFLTRAIAFVTFVLSAHSDRHHISCLLLVSPVQVLAGVSVSDTLEFLLQLCEVCRIPNRDIKDAAAQQVREKGDAHLYSSGVVFRKGLVLIQGVIRSFLRRRVRKAAPRLNGTPVHGQELLMTEGTRFLKELADGRIYNGIIRSVQKSIFVLGYEEDAEAQDKVNEIEMKIILEESQRLSAVREDRLTRSGSSERADGDISLADLPDLTESAYPHAPGFIKRVSSRDSASLLGPKASKSNSLKRAQSQRPSITETELFGLPSSNSLLSRKSTSRSSFASIDESTQGKTHVENNQQEAGELRRRVSKNGDWQNSLKKMLVEGRDAPLGPEGQDTQTNQFADTADGASAHIPSFPKLGIPGVVDTAFAGTYQTTDQRTQEKQALIRDIVMRIDSYMKRKRLRVIDLFRFCDADGNGSISPDEMIDTLSQMEIQLAPDQAREFLLHIDKDGNGSIDVDEFEELVRVARRNEAQREQLKKELNGPRKQAESKSSQKQSAVMKAKAKQSILDEFRAAQEEGGDGMSANHGNRCVASAPLSPPSSSSLVSYHHLAKALDELEWTNKSNRFLDQSWIRQFDSQLERAIREYEML